MSPILRHFCALLTQPGTDGLSDEDIRWLESATLAHVVLQIKLSG